MHPLVGLIATRPQLLAEHAQAYAELVAVELPRAGAAWKRQALLNGLAGLGLAPGLLMAGVALMLWAALGLSSMAMPWLLIAVPLVPMAAGIACLVMAQATSGGLVLGELRQQLSADLALLRAAAATP